MQRVNIVDKLCKLLGENLYAEVIEKLKGKHLYLSNGKLIPKYRLDELGLQLKKQRALQEEQKKEFLQEIEKLEVKFIVYRLVAKSRPKNFDVVLRLIKQEYLVLNSAEKAVKYQIRKLKKVLPQLFFAKNA